MGGEVREGQREGCAGNLCGGGVNPADDGLEAPGHAIAATATVTVTAVAQPMGDNMTVRSCFDPSVGGFAQRRLAAASQVAPPATSTLMPVRYDASSESRKATTLATSAVDPYRRSGTIASIWAATSAGSSA